MRSLTLLLVLMLIGSVTFSQTLPTVACAIAHRPSMCSRTHDIALRAITLLSAQILGFANHVGSIEIGKDGGLVITDGDVLEIRSKIYQVYIQGWKANMRDKHMRLCKKYQEKYRQNSR